MAWRRQGVVLRADGQHAWWKSAAGIPTCLPLHDRLWRIWFGGRDALGRSGVLCADVDPQDGMRILAVREAVGLTRGVEGAFDSAGLWASAALRVDGRVMLWYTGMRIADGAPHQLAIGLAVSDDGGLTFRKVGDEPVLSSPPGLPRFCTTPCVRAEDGGFRMWYSRGTAWRSLDGRLEPYYDLHCAVSPDGIAWAPGETPVLSLDGTPWAGLTRPWVATGPGGGDELWFSARGDSGFRGPSPAAYRIHRATLSHGGTRAGHVDAVDFLPAPSQDEWDGWMQVAPCVVPWRDTRVMFYNGNDFSRTGFGWAIEEPDVHGGLPG